MYNVLEYTLACMQRPMASQGREKPIRASLLLGVLTFNLKGRLARRNAIRTLSVADERVVVRFVMAADEAESDVSEGDVLLFKLRNASRRLVGKLLLQNAFYRYALDPCHTITYIGRAYDDALFNTSVIMDDLSRLQNSYASGHVAYGPFRNWTRGFR